MKFKLGDIVALIRPINPFNKKETYLKAKIVDIQSYPTYIIELLEPLFDYSFWEDDEFKSISVTKHFLINSLNLSAKEFKKLEENGFIWVNEDQSIVVNVVLGALEEDLIFISRQKNWNSE